jgi:Na+-transporting NADH:ubiquinone oxidoreductase subunit NqrC
MCSLRSSTILSFKPISNGGLFVMPPKDKDSIANTFLVSIVLCVVCSLLVSGAAVVLKPLQQKNKLLDKIASSGRHYRITTFLLTQDLKKLSPTIRDNASYIFVTKLKEHSLKTCFELSTSFKSFNEFKEFINRSCQSYRVVRIDLHAGYSKKVVRVFLPLLLPRLKFKY